ncbi:glycosyltransferase [Metabacillus halosaccharovorans]|uniref:glycosyltransferase n=1 Tax=Metabacillus halosaccharovorans TaxID=930124 RepID=UPI0037362DBC
MKKRIIFMIINMNVGGTEKALLNMINGIPRDQYDITILMLEKYGGFLKFIPSDVHVRYFEGYSELKSIYNLPPHVSAKYFIKKGKIFKAIKLIYLCFLSKIKKDRGAFLEFILKGYPAVGIKYDIAIAYAGPMDLITYYVLNKIEAKTKVQWVHFDVTKMGFNRLFESSMYKKFDKIFVVSKEGRNKLINMIPDIKDKTEVFSNIVSSNLINNQAKEGKGFKDKFNGLRILTVGRLTSEKGQDLAIRALARLIEEGYNVKWYCVGEGNSREKYEDLINEYNLKDRFIFLGADPNPYSYIDQCDIYVQPSRHEGYCITLAEARCLNKPIVTTDFTGAREQIKYGKTGLIVSINDTDIYLGVKELLDNQDLRNEFTYNLSKETQDSKGHIKKLYNLI